MIQCKTILKLAIPLLVLSACRPAADKHDDKDSVAPITVKTGPADSIAIKSGWAIEKYARQDLEQGGYKILSLEVDSLRYVLVSMRDFYTSRKLNLEKERATYHDVNIRLRQSGVKVDPVKVADDSVKTVHALDELKHLAETGDTAKNVIQVSYKLVAQTNANPYNTVYTKFLTLNNFSEVKMKFPDVKR